MPTWSILNAFQVRGLPAFEIISMQHSMFQMNTSDGVMGVDKRIILTHIAHYDRILVLFDVHSDTFLHGFVF